ncbi:MAG: DUF2116 family Zn-ribbon domain-containing protein [Cytophagales bacterium]|nr:DUF2116 family Zn-ribbon domain-containing protein [Cytophagales bacterium]
MERNCPECGNVIYGRADKKFCSDSCRNSYNNKQKSEINNLVKNTNNQLKKNRKILESICKGDKAKAKRDTLLKKGLDFNLVTSVRTTKKGSTYYFVYDYGYLELDNDFFLIVKDNRGEE